MTVFRTILPIIIILVLCSCLQHQHKITVLEDGSVEYRYTVSGDSSDLYDGLTALPKDSPWEVERYTEIDTSGEKPDTTHCFGAAAEFAPGSDLPACFLRDDSAQAQTALQHPLSIRRQDLFFMVNYIFEFSFPSRNSLALYGDPEEYMPEESQSPDTADTVDETAKAELEAEKQMGYLKWMSEMFKRRFLSALNRALEKHPQMELDTTRLIPAENMLEEYLQRSLSEFDMDEELDVADIWRQIADGGFTLIGEYFNLAGETAFITDLNAQGDLLNREYAVTMDLQDESFQVETTLPGAVRSTNADSVEGQNLFWEFDGEDFADSTIVLSAITTIYRNERIYIAAAILIIVLAAFLRWIFIQRKTR